MQALLIKSAGGDQIVELRDGKPVFAGRTAECDLHLPSPAVSRKHAVFLAKNGDYGVKDLESANGTYLNGKRITKAMRLKNGDVIQIGGFVIEFKADPPSRDGSGKKSRRGSASNRAKSPPPPPPEAPSEPQPEIPAGDMPEVVPESAMDAAADSGDTAPFATGDAKAGEHASIATAEGVARAAASLRRPTRLEISDDEVGDGGDDAAFLLDDAPGGEGEAPGGSPVLNQAAVEAGIVGEFAPDVEEEPALAVPQSADAQSTPDAIPLGDHFRQAVETRMILYSFLADLRHEREEFRTRRPTMPDAVKAELARQDRELEKIPSPEQAEAMIEKRLAKRKELMARIREAKERDEPPPPKPSRDMREAEEMAISQWTLCAQSAREALPAVYAEGYKLMADEPLAVLLERSSIDAKPLLGGAAYYLALEIMLEEARVKRQAIRGRLANLSETGDRKSGGMLGLFGKAGARDGAEAPAAQVGNLEDMLSADRHMADRIAWLGQEMATLEKALVQEFWRVYVEAALIYLPRHEEMPVGMRAFLRHGAIAFKKWWMKDDTRDHILKECAEDVIPHLTVGRAKTNILFAEEYLAAVVNGECTPALDENLEINERNSPRWKADKALRRLINARSQTVLLEELLSELAARIEKLTDETAVIEERMARLLPGAKDYKQVRNELAQNRQSCKVETSKLTNLSNRIRNETLESLRESIAETVARFDSGELVMPDREFLVRRECDAIRKIGRLLGNLKERFMPLVLRDNFAVGTDAVDDRRSIEHELAELERRDPGIFLESIVQSKKKASRVDLRISPVVVLIPSGGVLAYSWNPRSKPEDGRLALPTCFIRRRLRERQLTSLLADFRWDTSKASAGMDVLTSDTLVAAFMTVRWDWRKRSKEAREKGLIYTDHNDRTNWRRVYEAYMQSALESGKKLYNRNYDFYERIIGKYFDLPDNVPLLRK